MSKTAALFTYTLNPVTDYLHIIDQSGALIAGFDNTGTPFGNAAPSGAPATSKYILKTADASLPNAQALGSLATGLLKVTTTTGTLTAAAGTDVIALFTSCSGTQYLGADGACHDAGQLTINTTTNTLPKKSGAAAFSDSLVSDNGTVITLGGSILVNHGGTATNPMIADATNTNTGIRFGNGTAADITFTGVGTDNARIINSELRLNSNGFVAFASGNVSASSGDTFIGRNSAGVLFVGTSSSNASGNVLANAYGSVFVATAAITGAVPVKADTANANQVVKTVTSDTGAGIPIGVCVNSPGVAGNAQVVTTGVVALALGTGTCAIGQFVIVDTSTDGRIKCTSSYTAGTVIGVAMAAQAGIGSTLNVLVGLR